MREHCLPSCRASEKYMKQLLKNLAIFAVLVSAAVAPAQGKKDDPKLQIVEAANKYKSGDLAGAISQLETALEKSPDNVELLSWLGFFYIKDNANDKAVGVLEKAQKLRPDDLEVMNNLGNAYLAVGNNDGALDQYRMVVEKQPDQAEAWYNIGGLSLRKKDYKGAIGAYKKAMSLRPEGADPFTMNNLGIAYEGNGQLADAADCYKKAVAGRPEEVLFNRNAGFALLRLKKESEAVPYLEVVAKGGNDMDASFALAKIYMAQGKKAEALEMFESLESAKGDKSDYWYNLGVLRASSNDAKGAEEAYRKAISLNANDKDAINNLGIMLFKAGRYEDALPFFQRLYKMSPTPSATLNYAACCHQVGDLKGAVGLWKQYLAKNPSRGDVRVEMANAMWQMGEKDAARAQYAMVLQSEPNNVQAMNGIGLYYYQADRLKDAETMFRRSISAKSAYLPPYNNLAVTLERMNKRSEGIALLEKALKMNPDYAEARRNLERMRAASAR